MHEMVRLCARGLAGDPDTPFIHFNLECGGVAEHVVISTHPRQDGIHRREPTELCYPKGAA